MARLRTTIYCAAVLAGLVPAGGHTTTHASGAMARGRAARNADVGVLELAQASRVFESRWKVTLPDAPAAGAAYDTAHAYIPLRNGKLIAVALADGRVIWSVDVSTGLPPAAGGMRVFVISENEIRALNAADGAESWRIPIDGAAILAPVFDNGWIFFGTDNQRLVALRAMDGEVLWTLDTGAVLSASPAPSGDSVYLPLTDGRIVAADVRTGKLLWTRHLPGPPADILALDDRLFVGTRDNYFYCLALKDGRINWRWRTGGDIVAAPVVDEERVYFMSLDNVLRALDRQSGTQRWQHAVPGRTVGGPIHSGSLIVVATLSPQLHAYQRIDGQPAGSSDPLAAEETLSALIAAPQLISTETGNELALLTRQGVIQIFRPTS